MKSISIVKLLSACIVLLSFSNCKGNVPLSDVDASVVLTPLKQTQTVDDISSLVRDVELIEIVNDKRTYMSTITKMLLDKVGNMYMLDDRGNLAAIKPDGTYHDNISHKGRANNEYLNISDIAISEDEFLILDGTKVKCFDLSDPSRYRIIDIPVKSPCDAVAPDGNGGVYLYSAFPLDYVDSRTDNDYLLYRVSKDGELIDEYVRREDNTLSIGNIAQSSCNEYYLRPQNSSHIFYKLTSDGIKATYKMDFGADNIPHRYFFDSANEELVSYITSPYYKIPMELHETSSHVVFRVAGPDAQEITVLYDKNTWKGVRWANSPTDMQMQILGADKECFYAIMPEIGPDDGNHGPLFRYVREMAESRDSASSKHSYIVKISFGRIK